MTMHYLTWILPTETTEQIALLVITCAGLCFVAGARNTGLGLMASGIGIICLPRIGGAIVAGVGDDAAGLAEAVIVMLPWWVILAVVALVTFFTLRLVLRITIGHEATNQAMGRIASTLILPLLRLLVFLPLAVLGVFLWIIKVFVES